MMRPRPTPPKLRTVRSSQDAAVSSRRARKALLSRGRPPNLFSFATSSLILRFPRLVLLAICSAVQPASHALKMSMYCWAFHASPRHLAVRGVPGIEWSTATGFENLFLEVTLFVIFCTTVHKNNQDATLYSMLYSIHNSITFARLFTSLYQEMNSVSLCIRVQGEFKVQSERGRRLKKKQNKVQGCHQCPSRS